MLESVLAKETAELKLMALRLNPGVPAVTVNVFTFVLSRHPVRSVPVKTAPFCESNHSVSPCVTPPGAIFDDPKVKTAPLGIATPLN
ncbi:hypothetical protein D3C80_928830 [compost metagenome]